MQRSRLFSRTQGRLALFYAGVMAIVFGGVGMVIYYIILRVLNDPGNVQPALSKISWVLILSAPVLLLIVFIASWVLAGLAMQPIYRSYQHMQQFTADAAHELRTPLAATQATIDAALLQPQAPQVEDLLSIIQRQNHRLTQLVTDLLLLSQMDLRTYSSAVSNQHLEWEVCNLNNMVADLDEELAAMAINANINFNTFIDTARPLLVKGSSEQLYRVITNLIINAIRYTPAGGNVMVFLRQHNRMAIIQVKDTGIGIDPQAQKKIFNRFYRVNRSRHDGGSGLGLSIAKSIVAHHRGRLTVRSKLGIGSTFTLELPQIPPLRKQPKMN